MKTVNKQGKIDDPDSHLKWIQNKQKQIAAADLDYETKKGIAKEAKERADQLISELLQFIADLNNGQSRISFDDTKEEEEKD